jgi:hypothetical protein
MLLRQYLGRRLAAYYSQPSNAVVGSINDDDGINFSRLFGDWHWRRVYGQLYQEQEGQWLTPVELFRPYYSQILANFVYETCVTANGNNTIDVIELGGGRGTNAQLLLSHLQQTEPEFYNKIDSYTIVDSSPTLLRLQEQTLLAGPHASKIRFEQKDLLHVAEDGSVPLVEDSNIPTVVIALEVLDNLPHDKVRKDPRTRLLQQAEIHGHDDEVFRPLSDPLLTRILKRIPHYSGSNNKPMWVPSVACGVLEHLWRVRPNARLVIADFDYLPPPDLDNDDGQHRKSELANGEPLVTSMSKVDHECYLSAPNEYCDILFPTDFRLLSKFVQKTWKQDDVHVSTMKQSAFLQKYGPSLVRATQSWLGTGFTPLLHDFSNCTVLTVTRNDGSNSVDP